MRRCEGEASAASQSWEGAAVRGNDMFQGGQSGCLVEGELREVDIVAGQRPNVDKARKCIEEFGDEYCIFLHFDT
jgi:hypothetical protein